MTQMKGALNDLEKQRQRAEGWRSEAERLRKAIREHRHAVTVDENFGADEALWGQAGYPGRKGPGGRETAGVKPYVRVAA